jgi:hypothetical protein
MADIEAQSLNVIPAELLMFPVDVQQKYLLVLSDVSKRQPLVVAESVAWEVTKQYIAGKTAPLDSAKASIVAEQEVTNQPTVTDETVVVAPVVEALMSSVVATKEDDRIIVHIELTPAKGGVATGEFVAHADGDDLVFEGVLTDTMPNKHGKRFSKKALADFAEQINEYGIMGDISTNDVHAEWNDLITKYGDLSPKEFMKKARTERKGIVKVVKAVFDGARLWVKGVIDKRYKRFVSGVNKMSIEARIPKESQVGDCYDGGQVLGLTLVDERAVNPRSFIRPVA